MTLLVGVVDVDDAEAFGVARGPFEVIEQAPGEVATDGYALAARIQKRGEVLF